MRDELAETPGPRVVCVILVLSSLALKCSYGTYHQLVSFSLSLFIEFRPPPQKIFCEYLVHRMLTSITWEKNNAKTFHGQVSFFIAKLLRNFKTQGTFLITKRGILGSVYSNLFDDKRIFYRTSCRNTIA